MEVFKVELCAIRVTLGKSSGTVVELRVYGVLNVVLIVDLPIAIRRLVHLDPGPGQQLPRAITEHVRALHADGIEATIAWTLGHLDIPWNDEADCQVHLVLEV
jgi:hypothetical protein